MGGIKDIKNMDSERTNDLFSYTLRDQTFYDVKNIIEYFIYQ